MEAAAASDPGDGIWSAVRNVASQAGKYVEKVENDAWKWVDGKTSK